MATQNAATYRSDLGVLVRLLGCAPRTLAELYRYRASNALFEYGVQQQYEAIGEGALVGAGSVVTKNVPDRAVVAGNPATKVLTK